MLIGCCVGLFSVSDQRVNAVQFQCLYDEKCYVRVYVYENCTEYTIYAYLYILVLLVEQALTIKLRRSMEKIPGCSERLLTL